VKRLKRDYISLADSESEKPLTREKRLQLNIYEDTSNAVNSENHVAVHKRIFNDELWDQEWYLVIIILLLIIILYYNIYFVHFPVIFQ